jgi:hypothetical protein
MAKMRKVKRSLTTAVLVWIGRRMLRRVQKHTLRTVTEKPKALRRRWRREPLSVSKSRGRRFRRDRSVPTPTRVPYLARRRAGQGIAFAVLSATAVAVLKAGVGRVMEAEREQQVVTPDFDVFADDDE